jgi:CheY-like chemotaxis protein
LSSKVSGHIKVYSEPGQGTTFKIYLPRVHQAETVVSDTPVDTSTGGRETILVVEDDPAVRETVVATLAGLGYRVLKAHDGESALTLLRSGVQIDLLFTDVVMPGPVKITELARQAKVLLPKIEILFTSGYTQNAIVHGGRLDPGVELISKPYSRNELAKKVRRMLPNTQKSIPATTEPQKYPIKEKTPLSQAALRVVVVEDNDDANDMLCELIRLLGHEVQGVPSAEAAIDILRTNPPDILLTDMRLPDMSGLELAKKALSLRPDMHIIFSSGFGVIESVGLNSLSLPKPYDLAQIEDIFQKIHRQVSRQ